MKELFVAWQDTVGRSWYPVGKLSYDGTFFKFAYTEGANKAKREASFDTFPCFSDWLATYESEELFPLFSNRLLPKSRTDYDDFIGYLNVPRDQDDPITLLARSGGQRVTDNLELFPCPQPDSNDEYHIHFFAHGLRHCDKVTFDSIEKLNASDRLFIVPDPNNPVDPSALVLCTSRTLSEETPRLGYVPRYLTKDLGELDQSCSTVEVTVERINRPPAPLQVRLLCNLTACWPDTFCPFSGEDYQPINVQPAIS